MAVPAGIRGQVYHYSGNRRRILSCCRGEPESPVYQVLAGDARAAGVLV